MSAGGNSCKSSSLGHDAPCASIERSFLFRMQRQHRPLWMTTMCLGNPSEPRPGPSSTGRFRCIWIRLPRMTRRERKRRIPGYLDWCVGASPHTCVSQRQSHKDDDDDEDMEPPVLALDPSSLRVFTTLCTLTASKVGLVQVSVAPCVSPRYMQGEEAEGRRTLDPHYLRLCLWPAMCHILPRSSSVLVACACACRGPRKGIRKGKGQRQRQRQRKRKRWKRKGQRQREERQRKGQGVECAFSLASPGQSKFT